MLLVAVPFGLAIGLALGTLGGGGAVLAVPAFVYVLGQDAHEATTASLAVVATAALAGGIGHVQTGQVCWRHAGAFVGPAIGGILVGTVLNAAVGGRLLLAMFVPLILVAAWATWRKARAPDEGTNKAPRACPPLLVRRAALAGVVVGLLTGFFGVGGGLVVVPTLAIALRLSIHQAIATSLFIVSAVSLSALAAHLVAGNTLDVGVTAAMTAGCGAGAVMGARLAPRFSAPALASGFALLLTAVAIYMMAASTLLDSASPA